MKTRAYVMILTAAFLACGQTSFAAGYIKSKTQPTQTAVQAEPPAAPIGSLHSQFDSRRAQTKPFGFQPGTVDGVISPRDAASSKGHGSLGPLGNSNSAVLLTDDKPDKPQPPKEKLGIAGNGYAGMEVIEKQLGPKPKFDQWKDAYGSTTSHGRLNVTPRTSGTTPGCPGGPPELPLH